MPRLRFTFALLVLAAMACQIGPIDLSRPGSSGSYQGTIQASCAPFDAAAYELNVTPAIDGDSVLIVVWALPIEPGRVIRFDDSGERGSGARCPSPGSCTQAARGRINFDSFQESGSANGHFLLFFDDGTSLEGSFEAEWFGDEWVLCG